ncbi:SigB/SigF/SigG family RNA polymerase sigma factor [Nocardioides scoriae]|uniref:SigB/SigF/SigG family RNA polymerase sigma factor n=1 Tax=Nocardioides scoriae TaxID=642780 RepID=UPI0012F7B3CD|nr:SigB/SigF/SigG family RNA polymerase sigma factor [Nocardioides scoriae]
MLEQVVELHLDVAASIAGSYGSRGVDGEDLRQVACVGLLNAARRFDIDAGFDFMSFAVPTIRGEIRRYFRDLGWTVRPPRRVQELQQHLPAARAELERTLGRSPRPGELATHLGVKTNDVVEAVSATGCYSPRSLDEPTSADDGQSLYDLLGTSDRQRGAAEARVLLAPLVRELSERDRHVLSMRFFAQCTQREIAANIGVTQMQVSRMLTRILRDLRRQLADEQG